MLIIIFNIRIKSCKQQKWPLLCFVVFLSTGGVTSMDDFLEKFFPTVYVKKHEAKEDNYCKFDDQGLQLFTSSLYLAALLSSFIASKSCKNYGRKLTMQAASIFFLVGVVLNAAARDLAMLIIGRILLGVGIGFANQVLYLLLIFPFSLFFFIFLINCPYGNDSTLIIKMPNCRHSGFNSM